MEFQTKDIGYCIVILVGIIEIILAIYLPDKILLQNQNKVTTIENYDKYRKIKKYEFLISGLYFIAIGTINLINTMDSGINMIMFFTVPILITGFFEFRLQKL